MQRRIVEIMPFPLRMLLPKFVYVEKPARRFPSKLLNTAIEGKVLIELSDNYKGRVAARIEELRVFIDEEDLR